MKVRYIAIYKLHGANILSEGTDSVNLLALQTPMLTATLTTNPEPYLLHVDKSAALGAQLLKGLFAPDKQGTLQERLKAEIEDVKSRRATQTRAGVFLVLDGETDMPPPEFRARRDTDEWAIALDAIEKPKIREHFRPSVQSVLTALSLSLPPNADRRIEKVGEVIYFIDPAGGKSIYAFTVQGGSARLSIASPMTPDVIAEAAALAPKLAAEKSMARPASLLIASLEQAGTGLQAFIAAWSALEIFVNATFKSTYEARWFEIMEDGAPASAKSVFQRFQEVMSDKYRLSDKFLVIASVLDPVGAVGDAGEFRRLKKTRDELLHALDTPSSALPTDAIQKLLLKYVKLHLVAG